MSEHQSEEEPDQPDCNQFVQPAPIEKGDFLTMSQLRNKIGGIPEDETYSYNTSGVMMSQLTYSHSFIKQSNMKPIDEVSEGQQSIFSQLQNDTIIKKEINDFSESLLQSKLSQIERERDLLLNSVRDQAQLLEKIECLSNLVDEQEEALQAQEKKMREMKAQYETRISNCEKIIDDQTVQIKQLHRQINHNLNTGVCDKIKQKQDLIRQTMFDLNNLYDELQGCQATPKKQTLSRNPSRSQHSIYNTEPSVKNLNL